MVMRRAFERRAWRTAPVHDVPLLGSVTMTGAPGQSFDGTFRCASASPDNS